MILYPEYFPKNSSQHFTASSISGKTNIFIKGHKEASSNKIRKAYKAH